MAFIFGRNTFLPDRDMPDQSGKIIIVTGGNTGLGKESILQLVKRNPAKIYMGARNPEKAEKAIADLKQQVPTSDVKFLKLDVSDLQSVQDAAKEFLAENDRLDLLINNAGILGVPSSLSKDGYEIQFATNHLGPAFLTKLLLPTMEKTAAQPGSDVRIVNISSALHTYGGSGIQYSKVKDPRHGPNMMVLYGESKLANIYHAKGLAKRYPQITSTSIHPGLVSTDIMNDNAAKTNPIIHFLFTNAGKIISVDVPTGARQQLWAATIAKEKLENGGYYHPLGKIQNSALINDQKAADELWDFTEQQLTGFSPAKL